MKILVLLILAVLALTACTQTKKSQQQTEQTETVSLPQGEALLNILNANQMSLVVLNNDSLSQYNSRGVQDLVRLLTDAPERLKGSTVADKMVGRAAASLLIAAGVREVYTNVVSTQALVMLREAGIKVHFTEEVPQILNRDQSGQCPIEASINEVDNIEECVAILQDRFQ